MAIKLNKKEQALINKLTFDRNKTEKETITNPYSGHSCELEPQGVALHDYIKGCEALRLNTDMYFAINLFRKLYDDEYYTLLD